MRLDTIVSGFCLSVKDNDEEKWGQSVALKYTFGVIKGFAGLPINLYFARFILLLLYSVIIADVIVGSIT